MDPVVYRCKDRIHLGRDYFGSGILCSLHRDNHVALELAHAGNLQAARNHLLAIRRTYGPLAHPF